MLQENNEVRNVPSMHQLCRSTIRNVFQLQRAAGEVGASCTHLLHTFCTVVERPRGDHYDYYDYYDH